METIRLKRGNFEISIKDVDNLIVQDVDKIDVGLDFLFFKSGEETVAMFNKSCVVCIARQEE